jgi:hypothetical protein
MTAWRVPLASALVVLLLLAPAGPSAARISNVAAQPTDSAAAILAVVGRQVVWLNLEAPRHTLITRIPTPANALEVAALPDASGVVVAVAGPFPYSSTRGADLMRLDLATGETQPLVPRAEAGESLQSPAWWPDQATLLFERQDLLAQPVGPPGQEIPRYPSRIERVFADGGGREILVPEGRHPTASPDGTYLVYARTTPTGASLLAWNLIDGSVTVLVPEGRFQDLAYPDVSPDGQTVAFVAPQSGLLASSPAPPLLAGLFGVAVAHAHGIPWDPWVVSLDGSGLRRVAEVAGDEPSVTWSPDGTSLFVYSGTGSFIVDAASGALIPLVYVQGYGPAVWLWGTF